MIKCELTIVGIETNYCARQGDLRSYVLRSYLSSGTKWLTVERHKNTKVIEARGGNREG